MAFQSLFDVPVETLHTPTKATAKPRKGALDPNKRGCKYCPLNKVHGIQKIKGTITGKTILVIAQSPGPKENEEGRELLGPAGSFFWSEMKRVGLRRSDVDCFNSVKCFPADWEETSYSSYLKMRNPTKEEIHCCSLYTEENLAKSPAKQILILGQIAAKTFLKTRSLPPQKTFWSDELNARIYLVDHPAFFIRGYGKGPRMDAFRQTLQRLATDHQGIENTDKNLSDQFAYIRQQDYRLVTTEAKARNADRIIRKYAATGKRVTVDIEDDEFDDVDWVCRDCGSKGTSYHREYSKDCACGGVFVSTAGRKVIGIGICVRPGLSFFFVLHHPELEGVDLDPVRTVVTELLQDRNIDKALHYGCSDVTKLLELEGIIVRSFTHDTNLSEYLRFSDKKQYGLDIIGEQRFPEFSGWKLLVVPEMMKAYGDRLIKEGATKLPAIFHGALSAQAKFLNRKKAYHLKYCSLETLRLYNGGDCDVTKRIEISNRKHVPPALMHLYIDLSFVLQSMEPNGPLFDFEQHEKLAIIYPELTKRLKRKLRKLIGEATPVVPDPIIGSNTISPKEFNPASPQQCYTAIYGTLGLEYPFDGKPNTQKMALLMLGREHEFPKVLNEWRITSKVEGILEGYHRCATAWGGRLRTKWWSSGARTGRLSSGGEKNKKDSTIINLQNIKRDAQIRNLCVADKRWRRVYRAITKLLARCPETTNYWAAVTKAKKEKINAPAQPSIVTEQIAWLTRKIEKWIRKFMPDLQTYLILDYGQVEVRVAAQMSGDVQLIADCMKSDIHTTVGTVMTGWDAERIRHDEATRTLTKNVHFGILFGISKKNLYAFVLAMSPPDMQGRITEEQVGEAYDRYFARYPQIAAFIQSQRDFAREHGYVKTMFGMVQTLNVTEESEDDEQQEILNFDEMTGGRNAYWGNQAVNGPVQGTAHQLLICAYVNLRRQAAKYAILGIPPMEVHDALYFRVRVLELHEAYKKAKYLLEKESLNTVKTDFPDIDWKVPIVVEAKAGLRLGAAVNVDEKTSIGGFMIDWWKKTKDQIEDLDRQLLEVAA